MKPTSSKLTVLDLLKKETDFISLSILLSKMDHSVSDRTIRRWLDELIKEGFVEKKGQKKATKYRILAQLPDNIFSRESQLIIAKVRAPIQKRLPTAYEPGWIASYVPNKTFYIPKKDRVYLKSQGRRSKNHDPAGTYAHQIYNRLLIDLSYNSSRLEGNTYSLLDTQKLILEGAGAEGKLNEEKIMILNHKEAIRYLVDQAAKIQISSETIYTLHFLLSDGLVDQHLSGVVRDCGVRIGSSAYMPYENPKDLKSMLNQITKKAFLIEDPFEQSFFLLVHLSYLQPFIDVNKRTARLSANIPLIKQNFVPLSFNDIDKDDYISAILAIYELQNVRPLLDLYLFSYTRTCASYDSTVKNMGFNEIRVRYRTQRREIIREIILQNLHGHKMKHYIEKQTLRLVKLEDRTAFIEDTLFDIQELASHRLVGLGVTEDEFKLWKKSSPSNRRGKIPQ